MSGAPVAVSSKEQLANITKASRLVVANYYHEGVVYHASDRFYSDSSAESEQIAPHFQALSQTLARDAVVRFVKVNNDEHGAISQEYGVSSVPTFVIFRDAKVIQKVQGANPRELQTVLGKLVTELESVGSGSAGGSGSTWKGAEIPRGYSDITDQIETRNCELLNADEDAGPVRVLFESSKPSALDKGKGSSKDWVQSGSDDQLLLFIPLQSSIKLHTLQFTSVPPADEDDAPSRPEVIHLYINRPQSIDFDEADDSEPTQAITLTEEDWNADGTASVGLRFVKFQKTTTLIIYVQKGADGADTVRLDRVKLIGEAGPKREMGKLQKVGDEE